jgi:hypothetical protein
VQGGLIWAKHWIIAPVESRQTAEWAENCSLMEISKLIWKVEVVGWTECEYSVILINYFKYIIIFEYSFILYSDYDVEICMLITLFTYSTHFSIYSTISTSNRSYRSNINVEHLLRLCFQKYWRLKLKLLTYEDHLNS